MEYSNTFGFSEQLNSTNELVTLQFKVMDEQCHRMKITGLFLHYYISAGLEYENDKFSFENEFMRLKILQQVDAIVFLKCCFKKDLSHELQLNLQLLLTLN